MTFFETGRQADLFLLLLYAGGLSALGYDLLSPARKHAPRFLVPALDVLWCLIAAGLCAFALAAGGEGQLRLYALLGLCCGAGIYCLGVRRVFAALGRLIARKRKRNSPGQENQTWDHCK